MAPRWGVKQDATGNISDRPAAPDSPNRVTQPGLTTTDSRHMLQVIPNRPFVVRALLRAMLTMEPMVLARLESVRVTLAEQAEAEEMLGFLLGDDGRSS